MKDNILITEALARLKEKSKCDVCAGTGLNVFDEREKPCSFCNEGLKPLEYYDAESLLKQELQIAIDKSVEDAAIACHGYNFGEYGMDEKEMVEWVRESLSTLENKS